MMISLQFPIVTIGGVPFILRALQNGFGRDRDLEGSKMRRDGTWDGLMEIGVAVRCGAKGRCLSSGMAARTLLRFPFLC